MSCSVATWKTRAAGESAFTTNYSPDWNDLVEKSVSVFSSSRIRCTYRSGLHGRELGASGELIRWVTRKSGRALEFFTSTTTTNCTTVKNNHHHWLAILRLSESTNTSGGRGNYSFDKFWGALWDGGHLVWSLVEWLRNSLLLEFKLKEGNFQLKKPSEHIQIIQYYSQKHHWDRLLSPLR